MTAHKPSPLIKCIITEEVSMGNQQNHAQKPDEGALFIHEDWTNLRNQWEYTHATRAILQVVALGAFTCSILVETPKQLYKE